MIKAVIFDMDGLMIDSEPLWRQAQEEVFQSCGVNMTQKDAEETTGIRINEIVDIWYSRQPWEKFSKQDVTTAIVERVAEKILMTKPAMPGIHNAIEMAKDQGLKLAVASSSPMSLVKATINALGLNGTFEVLNSAENLEYAKPHPEVYINTAKAMGVDPSECIAIEDSFTGLLAAKSANMKTIVIPEAEAFGADKWVIADQKLSSLEEVSQPVLNTLL
ncbi:hexitol phosphatase HxpB [Vibrio sp. JC009]|uniref:hexitol phosphatase HxpB n=1 Tax=Vibrio sp. JC009 TaxID=2912314 RepID=UPI0023B14924|nr:hexitol phosphatase HxpB [Vibrio sp. JC009]WED23128.1 hexitol phosphatase HxpB [Vibrio sp. JC009]